MSADEHPRDPIEDLDEVEELESDLGEERSFDELRQRANEWSSTRAFDALAHVASTVASNLDFASLVNQILDTAIETVNGKRGVLLLAEKQVEDLVPVAARHITRSDLVSLETVSRTILRLGHRGNIVFSQDAARDSRFRDIPSVQVNQIRSVICVPLILRGLPRGVIYLDHDAPGAFPEHARKFVEAFASLATVAIENARLHSDIRRENIRMKQKLVSLDSFGRVITVSSEMASVLRQAAMAAKADIPVMLLGESGTGKELLSRAVHEASDRALGPFLTYNCAAIPPELMESIFFGHVKGAFSGAHKNTPGLFRLADQGVLFLDEVAELSAPLQAKLLRVLEDGIIRPLGSDDQFSVDVRLITATSRDLRDAVQKGEFREDLFYRMNVLELKIPPLRERKGDVAVLIKHFCAKHEGLARVGVPEFTEEAVRYLEAQPWRGNVRELENFVQRLLVMFDGTTIDREVAEEFLPTLESAEPPPSPAKPAASAGDTLADRERVAIIDALERSGGNKSKAARRLGIHRNSLARRMAKLGIVWEE